MWLEKRKSAKQGFHPNIMARLDEYYRKHVDQFLDAMTPYADSKETFDLFRETGWLMEDLVGGKC